MITPENTPSTANPPHQSATITIIVVGAGLAGLSLAIAVANLGPRYEVHVLEKRPDFAARIGATFGLAVPDQKALARITPEALEEVRCCGILMPSGGYMVPWWVVRDALLAAIRRNDAQRRSRQIHLHMGVTVAEIRDDGASGVRVTFVDNRESDRAVQRLEGALLA